MTTYKDQMARVWVLRMQGVLSLHEQDLYCYLIHLSSVAQSGNFGQSSEVMCAVLGINRNALGARRRKLQELSLIQYEPGKGPAHPPYYRICAIEKIETTRGNRAMDKMKHVSHFVIPSIVQVEHYCKEINSVIDPRRFHEYYTQRDWCVGNRKMNDWKVTLKRWEANEKNKQHTFGNYTNETRYVRF